jgi:hypothetical protein
MTQHYVNVIQNAPFITVSLNVRMQGVIMLGVIMLGVIMLGVIMLGVVAPFALNVIESK